MGTKDKNKDKNKDKTKDKTKKKNKKKDTDSYEDYDSVYAVQKECPPFTDYDKRSVKTYNCSKAKCHFKCKKGFELVNSGPVTCHTDSYGVATWSNSTRVTCIRKNY